VLTGKKANYRKPEEQDGLDAVEGGAAMVRRLLIVVLAVMLAGSWAGLAAAEMPYKLEKAERDFLRPPKADPSSSVVAADAVLGRPLGTALTIAGAGVFVLTLPFSVPSGSAREASWGLVGRPACWTFKRPLGRNMPACEETGVFTTK
jgi:hypothetical protein